MIKNVGAELFHAGGRTDGRTDTDMAKLIVAFCNIAKAPKMLMLLSQSHVFLFGSCTTLD